MKILLIVLGLALSALIISTIVMGVQKSQLKNELNKTRDRIKQLEVALGINIHPEITTLPSVIDNTTFKPIMIDYRLPDTMKPIHYDLYIHPDIVNGNFTGYLIISINCLNATNQIILHSHRLNISEVYLTDTISKTIYVDNYYLDTVREYLIIELNEKLTVDEQFKLLLEFNGSMLQKIVGLYSSSYLQEDNTRKWLATSKFEPTYARQAFPCFDEPSLKATFAITLVQPAEDNYHALSNMNIRHITDKGTYREVLFNTSVPMSTYLVCFIVSDFAYKSVTIDTNGIGDNFTLRIFADPKQMDKVNFALEVGRDVIKYYIEYFQIEYPLPKLDMVAIPDFPSGAMENWGLVTYREILMLYDKKFSSTENKQSITRAIAHEFAHMWFGNLVTMMWWNDLWLNEGFAKYIENKGINAKFPDWKMEDQFVINTLHSVMNLDATLGSHPIVQTVANPDQITEIFDTITYSKGASIIRMLEDFLGPNNFRKAVINYLNTYKYKNAVTDDFFNEIEKLITDIEVKNIMRTWTEQMGLPVVEIQQITPKKLRLTQKRFLSNPQDYNKNFSDSIFNYKWSIPITYRTNTISEVQRVWFYNQQNELEIDFDIEWEWIKFNYNQVGYYRVNYPLELWTKLTENLMNDFNNFSIADRAGLLNDAFSLADATQLPYDIVLNITKYLIKETDYVPWNVAASKLISLNQILISTDIFREYNNYALSLIKPIYQTLGWAIEENDNHLQKHLKVLVLKTACKLGLIDCLEKAADQFHNWIKKPNDRLHPDIREFVYYYGIMTLGINTNYWDKMWKLFLDENDPYEKLKLMCGLSATKEPWLLKRFIMLAWNEQFIRSQDYFTCLKCIALNKIGEPIVWDYVRENWSKLVERFGLNDRNLGNMIESITSSFATQIKLEEMQIFFNKYPDAGAGTAARIRALENVKNNIAWLENNQQIIHDWLFYQNI